MEEWNTAIKGEWAGHLPTLPLGIQDSTCYGANAHRDLTPASTAFHAIVTEPTPVYPAHAAGPPQPAADLADPGSQRLDQDRSDAEAHTSSTFGTRPLLNSQWPMVRVCEP